MDWKKKAWPILCCLPLTLFAKPLGHSTRHGLVHIQTKNHTTHITASDRAVIDWKSFTIEKGESVFFNQPCESSSVFNRVNSSQSTQINGLLEANGHVYLINPYGIVIGKHGKINAHAFTASTLLLTQENHLKDHGLLFSGDSLKTIENHGVIHCAKNIYLISASIKNKGVISSDKGKVFLATAHITHLDHDFIRIKWEKQEGTITNKGIISALEVEIHAQGGNPYALAINNVGTIQANSFHKENGRIYLRAREGKITTSGSLTANGGSIEVFAPTITIESSSIIDVSESYNPGKIFIGGHFTGYDHQQAETTSIEKHAQIIANATIQGSGGDVIIYAKSHTSFQGSISATGIGTNTSGGLVEVSSKNSLYFDGFVNISSYGGYPGTLLKKTHRSSNQEHPTKKYWSLDLNPSTRY